MTGGLFFAEVCAGRTAIGATVEITDLNPPEKRATLSITCMVKEELVIDGEAFVLAPWRL